MVNFQEILFVDKNFCECSVYYIDSSISGKGSIFMDL